MSKMITFKIDKKYIGESIRYFLQNYHVGKATIYKYSSSHLLSINGITVNSEYRFKANDILTIELMKNEVEANFDNFLPKIDIIYEDEDILIVNKPVNLIIHDDGKTTDTLTDRVNRYYEESGYHHQVLPAHRIDKDTSGIVVFAKHFISLAYLSNLFETRNVVKKYICVVENQVKNKTGIIETKLIKDNQLGKMIESSKGKLAITKYKVLKYESTKTRLEVEIETGRTHQIRSQLASINHPVVGDVIYGVKSSRLLLHFSEITFPMFRTNKIETFKSNAPF
ncbi:RluA family pseudouridine synthase [Acholeplasma granularum]|uniref:RluA family pseudouridine synthase n=1 Tax=Acholeplasma granularum TaxID=264635 RepID=UPI00046EDFEF|nr:RluA family pseudouridine synthase [Acholeplasma granularum]